MLVRQPISPELKTKLGIASIAILVGLYTVLSLSRQADKRADAQQRLNDMQVELANTEEVVNNGQTNLQDRLTRQRRQIESLKNQVANAVDRSVPTWRSLFVDGFLRVIRAQGLKRNEYWLAEDALATTGRLMFGLSVSVLASVILGV